MTESEKSFAKSLHEKFLRDSTATVPSHRKTSTNHLATSMEGVHGHESVDAVREGESGEQEGEKVRQKTAEVTAHSGKSASPKPKATSEPNPEPYDPEAFTIFGDFEACAPSKRAKTLATTLFHTVAMVHVPKEEQNDPSNPQVKLWRDLYGDLNANTVPRVTAPVSLRKYWLLDEENAFYDANPRRLERGIYIGGGEEFEFLVACLSQTRESDL